MSQSWDEYFEDLKKPYVNVNDFYRDMGYLRPKSEKKSEFFNENTIVGEVIEDDNGSGRELWYPPNSNVS